MQQWESVQMLDSKGCSICIFPIRTIANPQWMIMTQKYIQRVNSTVQTAACDWMAIKEMKDTKKSKFYPSNSGS